MKVFNLHNKSEDVKVFAVKRALSPAEDEAWQMHAKAMDAYYARAFDDAADAFGRVAELLPDDRPAEIMLARCQRLMTMPPAETSAVTSFSPTAPIVSGGLNSDWLKNESEKFCPMLKCAATAGCWLKHSRPRPTNQPKKSKEPRSLGVSLSCSSKS